VVLGVLPEERPRHTRESAQSYGEALKQQVLQPYSSNHVALRRHDLRFHDNVLLGCLPSAPSLNNISRDVFVSQMKESKECRARCREESERYHAKIEEEMNAFDPWGRAGAGAPLRDKEGNLICKTTLSLTSSPHTPLHYLVNVDSFSGSLFPPEGDLNKMHRNNESAGLDPEGGNRTEAEPSPNAAAPVVEYSAHNQSQQQTPGNDQARVI